MNKKQFQRVVNLYRDGVSARVCVENILGMCPVQTDASIWIDKFYHKIVINSITDNHARVIKKLQEQYFESREEEKDESPDREKPSDVED